jgi:hypothetical protein
MSKEFTKFEEAMRQVLSVSHEELQKRDKEWRARKKEKRNKSKKSSASREVDGRV